MKDLFRLIRKYFEGRVLFGVAVIFTTVQAICEIMLPRYMGDIVNEGVMTGDMDVVYHYGVRMAIFTIVLGIGGYIAFVTINIASLKFGNTMRLKLYDKVTGFTADRVSAIGSGSLITRLTGDIEKVISVIKASLDLIYKPLLLAVGGFLMIFKISVKFGFVFLIFILVQVLILIFFIKKTSPIFMQVQQKVDHINSKLQEILHSMRLIKASNTEDREKKKFGKRNEGLYERNIKVLTIMAYFNPIVMFLMNITIVVIIVMIGIQSHNDNTAIGDVMMAITYSEQILMSIMVSSNLARTISEIMPSVARLKEIDEEPINAGGENRLTNNIETLEAKGITFGHVEDKPIIKDLSLKLEKGKTVAILGGTAGGKTTLSMLLGGYYTPESGDITVNGSSIFDFTKESLKEHIAVVGTKNNSIFSGTIMDNLILGRTYVTPEDAKKAAETALISDYIESTSYGYDSLAYASGNTVSGGQRQRLMIARALAGNPDVLILDDSTSSLDFSTEATLLDNIRKQYKDIILLMITEREGSCEMADVSYTLTKGGLE